jgi:hypothetical protein
MNASINLLKNLKKDFLKNKKFLLSIPTLFTFKYLFTYGNKALCYAENNNSNEPNANDFNDIYADLSEEDLAEMQVPQEAISQEEMMEYKQNIKKAQVTPTMPFNRIPQLFMNPNDDKWNGLRFTLDWKPTKYFSLEYAASASSLKRLDNFRLSCLNIVPSKIKKSLIFQ